MITVRDLKFDGVERSSAQWCRSYEFSVLANSIFVTLPWLEPYFIHNVREAMRHVSDARVVEDAKAFIGQEARHAQQHRRYNQTLARRYPELPEREQRIRKRLDASKRKHSLEYRVAYTAGFEALTFHFLSYLFSQPERWFDGADPHVLAMFAWHTAEEIEHKSVAFDVLRIVDDSHALRLRGFAGAFSDTLSDIVSLARYMARVDGRGDRETLRRFGALAAVFSREFTPTLRHYLARGYHPDAHDDPPSVLRWLERHREGADLRAITAQMLDGAS